MFRGFSLILLILVTGASATAQAPAKKINYQEHILPFFQDKCVACHNPDKKSSGVILNSYAKIMEGGSSGIIAKPGNPEGSSLYQVVAHKVEPFMPPKGPKVSEASITLLHQWIKEGMLETPGGKALALNKPKTEIALGTVRRGRPEGPPPMPENPRLDPEVLSKRGTAVTAMAASPWAPVLAIGGQKQIVLYNTDTLDFIGVIPFPDGFPTVIKFSRNGAFLLAGGGRGGKSGKAILFNLKTGQQVLTVGEESDAVLAADFSPDQTQIALGSPSKVVRVYSTADGKLLHEIRKHTDWVTSVEYSPDGVLLASGDRNGGLFVWEAHTGKEYFSLRGHSAFITGLSWRADGNILVSTSEDSTLRFWELENGSQVRSVGAHGGGASAVSYHREGQILTSGRDRVAKIWDANGAAIRTFEALPDLALSVAPSHDATKVFVGDWTGNITCFNVADGKKLAVLASNPPSLKEQLEASTKELALLLDQSQKAAGDLAAVKTQENTLKAALDGTQKALAESQQTVKEFQVKIPQLQQAAVQAKNLQTQANLEVRSREILAQSIQESLARLNDGALKNKQETAFPKAIQLAQENLARANLELPKLKQTGLEAAKAVADAEVLVKEAAAKLQTSQSQVAALPKQVETQLKALQSGQAQTALVAAKAATIDSALAAKHAYWNRLKAALTLAVGPKS